MGYKWQILTVFLWIHILAQINASEDDYCYNLDEVQYRNYAAVTKYQTVFERKRPVKHTIENCEPSVFYMLARHGTRYPKDQHINIMHDWLPRLKAHILQNNESPFCEADLEALRNWEVRMTGNDSMQLAEEGSNELRNIATRLKKFYPGLLDAPYNESTFQFLHTDTERTRDSARAFSQGLFGTYDNITIEELKQKEDWLMNYYKNCEKYKEIAANTVELDKFNRGNEMTNVLNQLRDRLGLKNLTMDDVDTLWETCSYEYIIYEDSPWCMLFTKEELKVIEYQKDLRVFWAYGYGHEINYEQACGLLRDIMMHLEMKNINSKSSSLKVLTRFAHSGAVETLFARMGLYKDDYKLTASGYESSKSRKWRGSFNTPQAANIVFIRYTCSDGVDDKVALLINEEPVDLPIDGCVNGVCPLDTLKSMWNPITESCDLREICRIEEKMNDSTIIKMQKSLIWFLLSFLFLLAHVYFK